MVDYQVRRANNADIATLIDNNCAMAQETEGKALERDVVARGVRHLLDTPEAGFYLVALLDDDVVGSLMVTTEWSDWRNGTFWWIQSVYVAASRRRRGVYRALYAKVQALARQAKTVCGFRLYVERGNEVARTTYEALGMSETPYRLYEAPARHARR